MKMIEEHIIPYHTTDLRNRRTMVLAPHPDDETIGCGGTISLHCSSGDEVYVLFLTDGSKAGSNQTAKNGYVAERRAEAEKACQILGVKKMTFWEYQDRELDKNQNSIQRLTDLLREYEPEIVYAPSPFEIHPDHRATTLFLEESIKRTRDLDFQVAFYEVGHPIRVNTLIDISLVLEQKKAALECYQSQLLLMDYDEFCLSLNRFRSMTLPDTVTHAEGFFICNSEDIRISSVHQIFIREFDRLRMPNVKGEYWFGEALKAENHALLIRKTEGPLVSVILPTYNRPEMLRRAVQSVLSQTYHNFELIVVNDGGCDVSGMIYSMDPEGKVIYLIHKQNRGVAAARNTGLKKAGGKYIAYLDDDDIYYPDHLSVLIGALESGKYKVCYTDSHVSIVSIDKYGKYVPIEKHIFYNLDFDPDLLLIRNYIATLNLCHRADILQVSGLFDESLRYHEDWDLWIRISLDNEFIHVPTITGSWTKREYSPEHGIEKYSEISKTLRLIYNRYAYVRYSKQKGLLRYDFIRKLIEKVRVLEINGGDELCHLLSQDAKFVAGLRQKNGVDKTIFQKDCKEAAQFIGKTLSDIPLKASSIDAVIYFGISNPTYTLERVVEEAARLLKPRGKLILSVTNRSFIDQLIYSENGRYQGCLYEWELQQILLKYFEQVYLWGVGFYPSTRFFPLSKDTIKENTLFLKKGIKESFISSSSRPMPYEIIAVASDENVGDEIASGASSVVYDSQTVVDADLIDHLVSALEEKDRYMSTIFIEKNRHIDNLEAFLKDQQTTNEKIKSEKDRHIDNLEKIMRDNEKYYKTSILNKENHIQNIQEAANSKSEHQNKIIQHKEKHIDNLENSISELKGSYENWLSTKDQHIDNLEAILESNKKELEDLSEKKKIQEKKFEREMGELKVVVEEERHRKKQLIEELDHHVQQISHKETHIRNIEYELNLIKSSRVWRWSESFRILFYDRLLGRFPSLREKVLNLSRMGRKAFVIKLKSYLTKDKSIVTMGLINSDYDRWMKKQRLTEAKKNKIKDEIEAFAHKPIISIVMPVYNVEQVWLEKAIYSVLGQIYPNWELCIADDASTKRHVSKVLRFFEKGDERIRVTYLSKNNGISCASNAALSLATGQFIGFLDHDDELSPDALFECVKVINTNPCVEMIYSDEDKIGVNGRRVDPFFKPDYSPDLLLSMNYICHFTIIKSGIIKDIGGFRAGYDGSQDYDLFLRAVERVGANKIAHIPKILYHWRKIPGSAASLVNAKNYAFEAAKKALMDYLKRNEIEGDVSDGLFVGSYRVKRKVKEKSKVTIIIPFRDQAPLLEKCVSSILEKTDYPDYELLLVNNRSREQEMFTLLQTYKARKNIRVLEYAKPFNFAHINNYAVSQASGTYILLLNNDVEAIHEEWLLAMVEHAQRKEVGVVGAKLLFPDNKIQHAGVVMGIGVASHAFSHLPANDNGYFGLINVIRNYCAVTGACLMMRKMLYQSLGGMNEEDLGIAYNDVDLCLKAYSEGYLVVYTPYALLYHHESASRGNDNEEGLRENDPEKHKRVMREREYVLEKWGSYIQNDPFYNFNLTRNRNDFSIGSD